MRVIIPSLLVFKTQDDFSLLHIVHCAPLWYAIQATDSQPNTDLESGDSGGDDPSRYLPAIWCCTGLHCILDVVQGTWQPEGQTLSVSFLSPTASATVQIDANWGNLSLLQQQTPRQASWWVPLYTHCSQSPGRGRAFPPSRILCWRVLFLRDVDWDPAVTGNLTVNSLHCHGVM